MDARDNARKMGAWLDSEHAIGDPFAAAIRSTRMSMLITDPRQPDNPIVFANDAFVKLTGYPREEVIGRNCRFLQGPNSSPDMVEKMRVAIAERRDVFAELVNYRRDGEPFWNSIFISPVKDESGEAVFFFASQFNISRHKERELRLTTDKDFFEQEVAARTAELEEALKAKTTLLHEVDHRTKNNLQLVNSLLLLQSRRISDPAARQVLRATQERIEALGSVHRLLYQGKDVGAFDLTSFLRELVGNLVSAAGRGDIEVEFHLDSIEIDASKAAPLGLLVNEILTNAIKHAFADNRPGKILVVAERSQESLRIKIADDGIGMPTTTANGGTFGRTLIETLARQLRGTLTQADAKPGTAVEIVMPLSSVSK